MRTYTYNKVQYRTNNQNENLSNNDHHYHILASEEMTGFNNYVIK